LITLCIVFFSTKRAWLIPFVALILIVLLGIACPTQWRIPFSLGSALPLFTSPDNPFARCMDDDTKPFGSDQPVTDYLSHICGGVFTDEATFLHAPAHLSGLLSKIDINESEYFRADRTWVEEVSKVDRIRTRSEWQIYKSIPSKGSVWWPCWKFITFAIDVNVYAFPVCGIDRQPGTAKAFVRLYSVNKQGQLLQEKPIYQDAWPESEGFAYSELSLLNGRTVWVLKKVLTSQVDIRQVQSSLYAFHGVQPIELLRFDAFVRNWDSSQCKLGDISNCHADSWYLGNPWSSGQRLDMQFVGRRQLYNERYGEHTVDISTRLFFDEKTWRFTVDKPQRFVIPW
jgi:hypothetical protein